MDADGDVTHDGSVTIDVKPGQNPPLYLKLSARAGHLPITVTFGSYGVLVTPTTASITVTAQVQLAVAVTDANGQAVASPEVAWATSQPTVATVSNTGLVTGKTVGSATIVATYEGVAALCNVSVGSPPAISLSPTSVTFTGTAGGSSPAAQTVAVTNGGGGTLSGLAVGTISYGAGASGWLAAAVTPATAPATVTLTATLGTLSAGTYTATVPVSSTAAGVTNSPRSIAVTFTVGTSAAGFASVTVGGSHSCGLTATGVAYCWGSNQVGQLGTGSTEPQGCSSGTSTWSCSTTPVAVAGGLTFASLTEGTLWHTCGLTATGVAYCWGLNAYGEIGDGTKTQRTTPVAVVAPGLTFASLTAGQSHTCGLTATGAAYCWGSNEYGQLGDGTNTSRTTPVAALAGGLTFATLVAGDRNTCGLTPAGAAYCWGSNVNGTLGTGLTTGPSTCAQVGGGSNPCSMVPVQVAGGLTFASLTSSGHTCGLTPAGKAYCWGNNYSGQLGANYATSQAAPVAVDGGLTFASLSAGANHTCGLTATGAAYCWGNNYDGSVGNGSTTGSPELAPALVVGGLNFATVAAGEQYTCGLTATGAAYCWGWNYTGQLGDGTQIDRYAPVRVASP
jgi:alpha-tubulin suppressor-like RCC1 family protein